MKNAWTCNTCMTHPVKRPRQLTGSDKILKTIKMMKQQDLSSLTEMIKAGESLGMKRSTDFCNFTVAEGKILDD